MLPRSTNLIMQPRIRIGLDLSSTLGSSCPGIAYQSWYDMDMKLIFDKITIGLPVVGYLTMGQPYLPYAFGFTLIAKVCRSSIACRRGVRA